MQSRFLGRGVSKHALLAGAAFGLAACSGGGGSSSSSPPSPPPPPSNTAPALQFTVDDLSPDEGQPFIIDASGSTDADGDALTITITQTSGPDAGPPPDDLVVPAVEGVQGFSAPEVSVDEEMVFEITVSDGEDSVAVSVTVTATNIVFEPVTTAFAVTGSVDVPVGIQAIDTALVDESFVPGIFPDTSYAGLAPGVSSGTDLVVLEGQNGAFEPAQRLSISTTPVGSAGAFYSWFASMGYLLVAAIEDLDTVASFSSDLVLSTKFSPDFNVSIDAPCAIIPTIIDETVFPSSDVTIDFIVGRRGGGLGFVLDTSIDPDVIELSEFTSLLESGAYCAGSGHTPTYLETGGATGVIFRNVALLDYDSGNVTILNAGTKPLPEILNTEPLVDGPANGFEILSAEFRTSFIGSSSPNPFTEFMQVSLNSGGHDGENKVDVYQRGWTSGDPFVRIAELTWPRGVAAGSIMEDFDEDGDLDIAIALQTAPYVVYFENTGELLSPVFGDPAFLEVGLAVNQVIARRYDSDELPHLVLLKTSEGALVLVDNETGGP